MKKKSLIEKLEDLYHPIAADAIDEIEHLTDLNQELKESLDFWKKSFYKLWHLSGHEKDCYQDDYVVGCSCGFYVAEELYNYVNRKGN